MPVKEFELFAGVTEAEALNLYFITGTACVVPVKYKNNTTR
jgi:hypothetical protein